MVPKYGVGDLVRITLKRSEIYNQIVEIIHVTLVTESNKISMGLDQKVEYLYKVKGPVDAGSLYWNTEVELEYGI